MGWEFGNNAETFQAITIRPRELAEINDTKTVQKVDPENRRHVRPRYFAHTPRDRNHRQAGEGGLATNRIYSA